MTHSPAWTSAQEGSWLTDAQLGFGHLVELTLLVVGLIDAYVSDLRFEVIRDQERREVL
jgi:hypothetical protein